MNAANMPQAGKYKLQKISKENFAMMLIEADQANTLISYIGYPQNAEVIKKMTGVAVAISRKETKLQSGDLMLIMKLAYRVQGIKGKKVDENDFVFFACNYTK